MMRDTSLEFQMRVTLVFLMLVGALQTEVVAETLDTRPVVQSVVREKKAIAETTPERNSQKLIDDVGSDEVPVPLPKFPYEDYALTPHKTPQEEHEGLSDNRLPRPIQILRARNLLAAGHYQEAIVDYAEGLPKWKVPSRFRRVAEQEFALAFEKTGNIDDAIKHARAAKFDSLLARLYLKKNRLNDAMAVADNNILDERIFDFENHNSQTLTQWLQLRSVLRCHLKQYADAVADLKEAATRYYENDTEASNTCARAANNLIERFKLGAPFKLETSKLPSSGKERVLELVKYLSTSSVPFQISELNRITRAHIELGGGTWDNIHQEKADIRPFDGLEYRVESENLKKPDLFMLHIATDQCCVPKAEIDSLFPANGTRIQALSTWNSSDESPDAEAWKLPTGRLFLRFGKSGARVLTYLEFNAPEPDDKVSAVQLRNRAEAYWDNTEKKIQALTDAIKLDNKMIGLLIDRAHAYCEIGRFKEALIDAHRAVALGGRFYLEEQSIVEEKLGDFDAAIQHQQEYIGDRSPGPETTTRYTRLAELFVKDRKFQDALQSAAKALVDSKDRGAALFVKGQAEAGLGNFKEARADGKSAADYYFDNAEIIYRDRVLEWLKTIPPSEEK